MTCAFAAPFLQPVQWRALRSLSSQHQQRHWKVQKIVACEPSFSLDRIRRGPKPNPTIPKTLFDAEPINDIDFNPFDFATLKGYVIYALNVASEDAYTESNYELMAKLLDQYYDAGLRIIAFPSNWYGQKETKSFEEIKKFAHGYSDKIIVMTKTDLEWNQVFALGCKYFPGDIVWNFHGKFLFNRQGIPVDRFDLLTEDSHVEERIQRQLANDGSPAVLDPNASENTIDTSEHLDEESEDSTAT